MKKDLGLCAGVVKNQSGFMLRNLFKHCLDRIGGATAGPRGRGSNIKHGDVGFWAGISVQNMTGIAARGQKLRNRLGVVDRG